MNERQKSLDESIINSNESDINVSTKRNDDEEIEEELEENPIRYLGNVRVGNLSDWFMENHKNIPNVSNVRAEIRHVDPRKNLIMTAPDKRNKERYVWVFRDAHKLPVLSFEPYNMRIFHSNTFEIDYLFEEETKLITYNMKNKLLVFPSMLVEDVYIPYTNFTVLFDYRNVSIPDTDREEIRKNMNKNADFEFIMSKYKHIKRKKGKVTTNMDVIRELAQRKNKVHDVRHLITIDLAMIGIAKQTSEN